MMVTIHRPRCGVMGDLIRRSAAKLAEHVLVRETWYCVAVMEECQEEALRGVG